MSIRVTLDGQDITASLNKQYPLPESTAAGVFPDKSAGKWYDLLRCIDENETLKNNFFNGDRNGYAYGGVHEMAVINSDGSSFQVRFLFRMKYSARNH